MDVNNKIKISDVEGKGRGAFPTIDINTGDIILFEEKSICEVYFSGQFPSNSMPFRNHELNLISQSGDIKSISLVLLAARSVELMRTSNELRSQLFNLCIPDILSEKEVRKLRISTILVVQLLLKISIEELEETCFEIICRLACNAITITDSESSPIGLAIFIAASSVNHSCDPNANIVFNNSAISIVADRAISTNDEIFISYTDSSKSSWCRRFNLLNNYYFSCQCTRCNSIDIKDGLKCGMCSIPPANMDMSHTSIHPSRDSLNPSIQLSHLTTSISILYSYTSGKLFSHKVTAGSTSIDMFVAFLEELSIPFGDVWMDLMTRPSTVRDFLLAVNNSISHDNSIKMQLDNIPLVEELLDNCIPPFSCDICNIVYSKKDILMHIKEVFDLWTRYKQKTLSRVNNVSAIAVVKLRDNLETIQMLENVLKSLLTFVSSNHYCVAQCSHMLIDILTDVCITYDTLLIESPNNKKLKLDVSKYHQKYLHYSEMLNISLKNCYPKYIDTFVDR